MRKLLSWLGLSTLDSKGDTCGNLEDLEKDHELYGTYFEIPAYMDSSEVLAIQDWIKDHPDLTFKCLPCADILGRARFNGTIRIGIDEKGVVDSSSGIEGHWRKVKLEFRPCVSYYTVEPKTVKIGDKHYDKAEVEELLSQLTPKEMS